MDDDFVDKCKHHGRPGANKLSFLCHQFDPDRYTVLVQALFILFNHFGATLINDLHTVHFSVAGNEPDTDVICVRKRKGRL
jgi:hypothetical protein